MAKPAITVPMYNPSLRNVSSTSVIVIIFDAIRNIIPTGAYLEKFKKEIFGYIDVGYRCWWRDVLMIIVVDNNVGDSFGEFGHQNALSFYTSIGHLHSKDVTNIKQSSSTLSHQLLPVET